MVGGAGPGPEAELALAKTRYRSKDPHKISKAYASDARYTFMFWLVAAVVFSAALGYFSAVFFWVAIPLIIVLLCLIFLQVRKRLERDRMMDEAANASEKVSAP